MITRKKCFVKVVFLSLFILGSLFAQDKTDEAKKEKPKFKEYSEVITDKAVTDTGVFTTHMVEGKLYYEIPESELGKQFLWVTTLKKVPTAKGYGGTRLNNRVVQWDRRGDQILLKDIQHSITASEDQAIYNAVDASSFPSIIYSFDIVSFGANNSPVIEAGLVFTSDTPEFSPKKQFEAKSLDKKRTFIEKVTSFETNVELDVIMTFVSDKEGRNLGTVSALVHHSMVHLPTKPFEGRKYDTRVGFFNHKFVDYGIESHVAENISVIARWRLEKKNPNAKMSDPIKPIVYYIDRSVPDKWVPYMVQGVNDWQVAFEAAGFTNAIFGKKAPTIEEDPDWSTEDAQVASISWLPSTIQNAFGPHISDPRTGEILDSDVKFYHNVMQLARNWYFTQASPNDKRAQKLPLPDDLMGELIRYIASHEIGHAIGMQHNMKASSSYTVTQLRDKNFTNKYGNEASIMDYGRFNYVAQPGDNARLIPMIGPYDKFAIEWAYREFKEGTNIEKELDKIALRQSINPQLLFSPAIRTDPSAQTEDLGADPVEATTLGLKNLKRVTEYLVSGTTTEGEDYSLLENVYNTLINQFNREMGHVATVVGGVVKTNNFVGQDETVFKLVPYDKQKEALKFLNDNFFNVPIEFLDNNVLNKIQAFGNTDRVLALHGRMLRSLISDNRVKVMTDQEALDNGKVYRAQEMLEDLRNGIWSEVINGNENINPYRRNLQRAHVEELISKISGEKPSTTDLRPLARGELSEIESLIKLNIRKVTDRTSSLHLEDISQKISSVLESK